MKWTQFTSMQGLTGILGNTDVKALKAQDVATEAATIRLERSSKSFHGLVI